jgi:hypothetical protein
MPDPVEGASEIDILIENDEYIAFIEAKLGSDVSLKTSYDPQRNQIVRNIDCLIERAKGRFPLFWILARDQEPTRAYVQLMNCYKSDPSLLASQLPHRETGILNSISRNLTIVLWADFAELVCSLGVEPEMNHVKQELERRIFAN